MPATKIEIDEKDEDFLAFYEAQRYKPHVFIPTVPSLESIAAAWKCLPANEKLAYSKNGEVVKLFNMLKATLNYTTYCGIADARLQLNDPLVRHYCYLVDVNYDLETGRKELSDWDIAMYSYNIAFCTTRPEFLPLAKLVFEGLWNEEFNLDDLVNSRGVSAPHLLPQNKFLEYLHNPGNYPGGGIHAFVAAINEGLTTMHGNEGEWRDYHTIPPETHHYRSLHKNRRSYTWHVLSCWVKHEMEQLVKQYPEILLKRM